MKSRISFFNRTVFRKNITRFAPVWALYSVFLLMRLVALATGETYVEFAENMIDALVSFSFVNFWYAPLCALLLFGDLYKSRMCNALHAMPIRRETWFSTNVISGLLFSLVPNTVFALICLPFAEELFAVPLLWLLGVSLQYVFFFGTAVLAVYCVGNYVAMALVYLIFNFFSGILYALVELLYIPLMYGVESAGDIFAIFIPLIVTGVDNIYVEFTTGSAAGEAQLQLVGGWAYLVICACVGIAFLALARCLYRRRNLESAGDLLAVRKLRPVFLTLYTLCAGICCYAFADLFLLEGNIVFLILGLAVGVYTGQMLLDRTVSVFRKRTFIKFIIATSVMCISLVVVVFDMLGIVRWVPKVSNISSVTISTDGFYAEQLPMTTAKEIDDVLMMHRHGLEHRDVLHDEEPKSSIYINYTLKNGATVHRHYWIALNTEAGQCLKQYDSSPEAVLGELYTKNIPVKSIEIPDAELMIVDQQQIRQLMDAIVADCKDANLPQDWGFRRDKVTWFVIELQYELDENRIRYRSIQFGPEAKHIMQWLEQNGISPVKWENWENSQ